MTRSGNESGSNLGSRRWTKNHQTPKATTTKTTITMMVTNMSDEPPNPSSEGGAGAMMRAPPGVRWRGQVVTAVFVPLLKGHVAKKGLYAELSPAEMFSTGASQTEVTLGWN